MISNIEYKNQLYSDEYKGNVQLDVQKVLSILKILLQKEFVLTKVKTAKLLWYCDMMHYKYYHKGITGMIYVQMPFGPLPEMFSEILDLKEIGKECELTADSEKVTILSVQAKDCLLDSEKKIVNLVCNRFKNFSSKEFLKYMQRELSAIDLEENEPISYDLAENLTSF